ncbi:MAG TPA: hypothetical protein VGG73_02510 [Vicinamibacterales bacterium]
MSPSSHTLNPITFVALGDGLTAGAGDFGMSEELQPFSFPAQVARRLATPFPQPEMEAPGIGPVIGFADLPVRLPQPMQTTVLKEFPPSGLYSNVSISGLKLIDALTRRPISPLIHRSDGLQTAINLVLGLPGLLLPGTAQSPTAVEYALFRRPTLTLVGLGCFDVIDAAMKGDPSWIPDAVSFRMNYASVLTPFGRGTGTLVVCTLPDPSDTALFTPFAAAPRVLKADCDVLAASFGLHETDNLTPAGLIEAGCRLIAKTPGRLPEGSVVRAPVLARISERVASLNLQIRALAQEHNAIVLDLHALFARVKRDGVTVGGRRLTADYLGGFYSLNGVYPGATGHGVIANEMLRVLNENCGASLAPIDLSDLLAVDPVIEYRLAPGPARTLQDVAAVRPSKAAPSPVPRSRASAVMPPRAHITLPDSLEATLTLNQEASYVGDALRAAHTSFERDIPFGSAPNTLFGGLCLTQTHLHGQVTFRFSPPKDNISSFTMSLGAGLQGEDGILTAPQYYKLPSLDATVTDVDGLVSVGTLNLATGEVSDLNVKVTIMNSALRALVSVNPKLPPTPIEFSTEARQPPDAHYGSVWGKFEQRADGTLDFTMNGVEFLPLGAGFGGDMLRFPLPFAGEGMEFASVPAVSTSLHPHISLSTKPLEEPTPDFLLAGRLPEIPINTVREYSTFSHNTAFGDKFTLNVPEMEGGATGRSHLVGRLVIQFGERSGNSVPFVMSSLLPGGLLAKPPDSPVAKEFPGRLSVGLLGHDEILRFPKIQYHMQGVCWVDDPFEVSIGSIDVRTGKVIGNLLYRGFIVQTVLLTLLKLEPRTPKSSWYMRGPAAFERDPNGQTIFGFCGTVKVAYPEGYGFPRPDLKSAFTVGPNSVLDPYIYLQGMDGIAPPPAGKSGQAHGVLASNGQRFSYSFAIPGYPSGKPATFEYTNEATGGTFKMGSLVWVSFGNAKRHAEPGDVDCVTFTGIGLWTLDMSAPHMCNVQICTAPDAPFVSIIIDGGSVSNVNTKPAQPTMPFADMVLFA